MKQAPTFYKLETLMREVNNSHCQTGLPDGRWVPTRPSGFASLSKRFKLAMLVFTGHCDAVKWPGQ